MTPAENIAANLTPAPISSMSRRAADKIATLETQLADMKVQRDFARDVVDRVFTKIKDIELAMDMQARAAGRKTDRAAFDSLEKTLFNARLDWKR